MQTDCKNEPSTSIVKPSCQFCMEDSAGKILNTCPRCNARFCSQICYRHVNHLQCSEAFYEQCVKEELKSRKESEQKKREFLDRLQRQMVDDVNTAGSQEEDSADDEVGSTNSSEIYQQLEDDSLEVDEREIDRQLDNLGVGHDPSHLLGLLSNKQKERLTNFANKHNIQLPSSICNDKN